MIKENSLSFNDKKKADIVIIDAIMNLMTTRQRDDEDLTKFANHFKAARDLCKEKYGEIFKIPTLIQKESTWGSDQETRYKTAYACFLSILYLKNRDQMMYGSFIKKMAEVFTTGQENIYLIHIKDVNMFCPSTSMTKLIMLCGRSDKMIVTKVTCPQGMTIIQPLGMNPL